MAVLFSFLFIKPRPVYKASMHHIEAPLKEKMKGRQEPCGSNKVPQHSFLHVFIMHGNYPKVIPLQVLSLSVNLHLLVSKDCTVSVVLPHLKQQ